jgi:hypothetical protein
VFDIQAELVRRLIIPVGETMATVVNGTTEVVVLKEGEVI